MSRNAVGGDAVVQHQESDRLRHGMAAGDHHEQRDQHHRERSRGPRVSPVRVQRDHRPADREGEHGQRGRNQQRGGGVDQRAWLSRCSRSLGANAREQTATAETPRAARATAAPTRSESAIVSMGAADDRDQRPARHPARRAAAPCAARSRRHTISTAASTSAPAARSSAVDVARCRSCVLTSSPGR